MKETIHEYLNNKVPSFMINEKKNNYHFKIIKPCNTKGIENVEFVDYYTFTANKKNYLCIHEPINPYVVEADKKFGKDKYITLFGHIHGRNFAKTNGFDFGIDYHRYAPISLEQVEWFRNAMQYWDINVHTGAVMQEPSK